MDVKNDVRRAKKEKHVESIRLKESQRAKTRRINQILKKLPCDQTEEERQLLKESRSIVKLLENRKKKILLSKERLKETEDLPDILEGKCVQLADAIRNSKHTVIYTGAGISTAAHIPDYRGPNGIWTQLNKTGVIDETCHTDLSLAQPTLTHMAITELHRRGLVKHVVSQNCDGLHVRSGIPQTSLSEIHGNMYIEVCSQCQMQYLRAFDVTEKTSLHRHKTGRKCYCCGHQSDLIDTIVHFGEKGKLSWPLNWDGAAKAVDSADLIVCLGSSLKILRRYPCLWPKKHNGKPELFIVNLQFTPKDSQANLKIYGKCDQVMRQVMNHLQIDIPSYKKELDPIYFFSTPLKAEEEETCNRIKLCELASEEESDKLKESISYFPSWFGKGLRRKK